MKKHLLIILIICISIFAASCNETTNPASDITSESLDDLNATVTDAQATDTPLSSDEIIEDYTGEIPDECAHANTYTDSYHSFDSLLIQYVTSEKFNEWVNSKVIPSAICPYDSQNIYEFIKHFAFPRDAFEDLYYNTSMYYTHDYDIDLLFSGDAERINEYYENGGAYNAFVFKSLDYSVKIHLMNLIDEAKYNEWMSEKSYTSLVMWSIPEFIYKFEVSQEHFMSIVDAIKHPAIPEPEAPKEDNSEDVSSDKSFYGLCDYNYDMIYKKSANLQAEITNGTKAREIEMLIHK